MYFVIIFQFFAKSCSIFGVLSEPSATEKYGKMASQLSYVVYAAL